MGRTAGHELAGGTIQSSTLINTFLDEYLCGG